MERDRKIHIILQALFVVSTIITVLLVYNIIKVQFAMKFVVGYVVFLLIYSIYLFYRFILNARKLKWIGLRSRVVKFIAYFIVFSAINYVVNYMFRPASILSGSTISFGTAFGFSFYDLMFTKKQ